MNHFTSIKQSFINAVTRRRPSRLAHVWRSAIAGLLFALMLGSPGPAAAAQSREVHRFFIDVIPPAGQVCAGSTYTLIAKPMMNFSGTIRRGPLAGERYNSNTTLSGVWINAKSLNANGGITPARKFLSIYSPTSYTGEVPFEFTAKKAGTARLMFDGAWSDQPYAGIQKASKPVSIFIQDCKFTVKIDARWTVQGDAKINFTAEMPPLELKPSEDGFFITTGSLKWDSGLSSVFECGGTLKTDGGSVTVSGQILPSGNISLDLSFEDANGQIGNANCGNGLSFPLKLQPITWVLPNSGGRKQFPTVLTGPGPAPGFTTVTVTPAIK